MSSRFCCCLAAFSLFLVGSSLRAQRGDRAGEVQAPPPSTLLVPPSPALPVEDALKSFKIAPGFRLEVVASEPLVSDPIAMTIGPDGRMWVVEMHGYMPNLDGKGEEKAVGSIVVLEDTDGDGRMDKRTVFLDHLVMPRALALVDNGVLVAEPPKLWYCRDIDGNGVCDQKVEIANDYGNTTNPEHTANGLMTALDNWIYSANLATRFRYEGNGKFRRDSTITRGQWGITQDDSGRIYYNSNSDPLRVDLAPSDYLKRNANFAAGGSNVQVVPASLRVWPGRVTPGINRGYKSLDADGKMFEVTAACAPLIYRGALFPADFAGNAFICEPAGNLVKRIIPNERDGGMTGRNGYLGSEFLTSTDERFRPVNLTNGPDGAIYIVDMYRGLIQHRTYVTSYLRKQVEDRKLETPIGMGRIYRVVPDNAPAHSARPNLLHASSQELVALLSDGNGWTRDTAQRLLVENRDQLIIPVLRTAASTAPTPLGKLHALWTLEGMGALDRDTVLKALRESDPRLVAAAIRLAEPFCASSGDAEVISNVLAKVKTSSPAVRLQLALSLGEMRTPEADMAMRQLATSSPAQPYLADAIVSGLAGREELFVASLATEAKHMGAAPTAAVAYATSAVLRSGDVARIEGLLSLTNNSSVPAWTRSAVLDGVLRIVPKTSDGKLLMATLPAEPTALIALSTQKENPDAVRAEKLLAQFKWPGKPGVAAIAPVELTPAQKALFEKGQTQYAAVCAACHQPSGQGMPGLALPLVNSRWVLGDDRVLARIVLCGKVQENLIMPSMRTFDDETLAGVLTFIRRSWGHEASPVTVATVAEARAAIGTREEPWSDSDLEELVQDLGPPKPSRTKK